MQVDLLRFLFKEKKNDVVERPKIIVLLYYNTGALMWSFMCY